ncbi:MAG: NADH-quinone oxidoreductase subunit N [SAR202 cluster bacterium]|nr:NADH-quinone oxidoreductase subunit N [SAR202 cluster bacterium]
MTGHDLYLLSPELSMAGLATILVVLDLFLGRKDLLAWVAVLGLLLPLGFAISLWVGLDRDGTGQMAGLFDTLSVDKFSLFFKFLFIGTTAAVVLTSTDYVKRLGRLQGEYYALILFSATGMMLLASTTELITIYIALELTALPVAALAAFMRDSRSSESGMKFLILSAISSAVLLYGMVWVYGYTGTTNLEEIARRIGDVGLRGDQPFGGYALLLGVVLMIAGFGFKIASVPFQMWAPDVYEGAPTPVTAFLSVASKAAGFAILLRIFYVAFPWEAMSLEWSAIFAILAVASMTLGNLVAIPQRNIKRMLAYSTIAHAGYLLVGLAAATSRASEGNLLGGPTGILFYLGGYAVTNMAAFGAVIAISNKTGSDRIEDFAGMARRAPLLAAVLTLALVSLTGVPPTVGFMVKLNIFGAAVDSGLTWLAIAGALNSVISAYYYVRVVKVMYLSPPAAEERVPSPLPMTVAVTVAMAGVAFFGVYPAPLLDFARTAAATLRIALIF